MVFLVHKLAFHHHHNHHPSEAFLVSLQAFRSEVSNSLAKLMLNSDHGPEFLSFKWLQECFEVLAVINRAFAKLVVEIDYPMTQWEVTSMEEYLGYSLTLLDSLNSISSALSQLSQARVLLSHALSVNENTLVEFRPLPKIIYKIFGNDLKVINVAGESKRKGVHGKELVLHEALLVLKNIGSWVCSVVASGLCSDAERYLKMKNTAEKYVLSPLIALDSIVNHKIVQNKEVVKEMKAVNDTVKGHVLANGKGADFCKELQGRLEAIEKAQTGIEGDVDLMFSYVLAVRKELINTLRQRKQ
ncbi:hypothetical protein DCAR_0623804 [Daucus carota subsp. sativus]|uniref:Protein BPS1, chloroplastic n=1 Tax=Daucus carota subsp. sativus TaxID=79200 RepID=A0AAF0XAC0_DAUCS|nr:hypothetical protein DCAR_0623804 [Daucus carota subsp. sativus]